jgi:hypothetical protein
MIITCDLTLENLGAFISFNFTDESKNYHPYCGGKELLYAQLSTYTLILRT